MSLQKQLYSDHLGEMEPDSGSYKWGVTTSQSYFPKDNTSNLCATIFTIVDWLTQYFWIKDATCIRGFLGRMLFASEDGTKKMRVLSGGESRVLPLPHDDPGK